MLPVELNGLVQTNGKPVTTAVVEWGDFLEQEAKSTPTVEHTPAFQSLKEALENLGDYSKIAIEDWRNFAYQNSNCSNTASKRTEFNRFKNKLLKGGIIEVAGDSLQVLAPELTMLNTPTELSDQGLESDAVH